MVSDASKKKAAQKKAAAAAKRGGKAAATSKAAAAVAQSVDKLADGVSDIQISDRNCTGVLCSHPMSRDVRVRFFDRCLLCEILLFLIAVVGRNRNCRRKLRKVSSVY